MTTVLADCPTCETQRECKILDCDSCFEGFVELGGDPNEYDGDRGCEHLECLTCQQPV